MSFETVPLVIIIICVLLVIGGAAILLRQKWLVQWFKGTAGLLLVGLAVYFSLFALNLFSYNELREGSPIATVSFRQMGPQQYMATVSEPDGSNVDYPLSGDLWQIDARIVRWKGLFALFGFSPGYQLDRIQGRYLTLEDERSKHRSEADLAGKVLTWDFGPDDAFMALYDKCFSKQIQQYEYEVCLYSRATQRGRGKGKAAFSLGREWAWETAGAVGVLRGGDKCGAGPKRSVRITFECAESEKLGPVSERSTCAYATTLATPAAC